MAGKMRAKKFRRPKSGHQGEVMTVRRRRAADCLTSAITRALWQKRNSDTLTQIKKTWRRGSRIILNQGGNHARRKNL
jgi:hypothetical protein